MTSDFADLHDDLRAVARDLVKAPSWVAFADAGWLGLEVPEALDGAGVTFAETAVVLEELGRAAVASPFLGTVVLGVGALTAVEPNPARDDLLRVLAMGEVRLAVALAPSGQDALASPAFRLEGGRLTGSASFVVDAPEADRLLLLADDGGSPVLVAVEPPGVSVTAVPVVDATRSFGDVAAERAEPVAVWPLAVEPQALLDRAAVAVACDSIGVASAMLDATVAYAKVRTQFDQPIGAFQSVKHQCADALVALTIGRELLDAAVADPSPVPVARASSFLGQAAVDVVGTAMQLHGGIGYTWESGIHTYLKRAILDRSLFGSPAAQRRRLAASFSSRPRL